VLYRHPCFCEEGVCKTIQTVRCHSIADGGRKATRRGTAIIARSRSDKSGQGANGAEQAARGFQPINKMLVGAISEKYALEKIKKAQHHSSREDGV
jgi:hypothetical protein